MERKKQIIKILSGNESISKKADLILILFSEHDFNSLNAEFGLGNASIIDSIRIEWTSGNVQVLTNVAVNQFLTITEQSDDNTPPNKITTFFEII